MNEHRDSLCMLWADSFRVSRMREICTSGLRRGEEAAEAVPLLLDFNMWFRPEAALSLSWLINFSFAPYAPLREN